MTFMMPMTWLSPVGIVPSVVTCNVPVLNPLPPVWKEYVIFLRCTRDIWLWPSRDCPLGCELWPLSVKRTCFPLPFAALKTHGYGLRDVWPNHCARARAVASRRKSIAHTEDTAGGGARCSFGRGRDHQEARKERMWWSSRNRAGNRNKHKNNDNSESGIEPLWML